VLLGHSRIETTARYSAFRQRSSPVPPVHSMHWHRPPRRIERPARAVRRSRQSSAPVPPAALEVADIFRHVCGANSNR
jgi:hypothetical protein